MSNDGQIDKEPIQVNLAGEDVASLAESAKRSYVAPTHREITAKRLAIIIVWMAGISLGLLMLLGFSVIIWSINNPEHSKQLIIESVIPLIEKLATFFTTAWGPLLAFVLGYYFGERQAQRRSTDL
jgi:hypothetical protein